MQTCLLRDAFFLHKKERSRKHLEPLARGGKFFLMITPTNGYFIGWRTFNEPVKLFRLPVVPHEAVPDYYLHIYVNIYIYICNIHIYIYTPHIASQSIPFSYARLV